MSLTWVAAILAIGSFFTLLYFGADVAVLIRGPGQVPPEILRLAQAGQRRIAKGSLAEILGTATLVLGVQGVVAAWLVLDWGEMDPIARTLLAGELLAAAGATVALWRWILSYRAP
jgi:hypothetical protein